MLYAWVDGVRRSPLSRGERAVCRACGGELIAVLPVENVAHWRHRGGDCDPWSEPEGPWHLSWKEAFDLGEREVVLVDEATGERHRADVLCGAGTAHAAVLELQHSSIPDHELDAREAFYRRSHRMFWLVHVHSERSFLAHAFGMSVDFSSRPIELGGRTYAVMRWMGSSKQFIEKWKRAGAHVFFDLGGRILHLADAETARRLGGPFRRGEFALCRVGRDEFVRAVSGRDRA